MTKHVRCAIYTRKSSDEGLEQEFNSLEAQFESCRAFIVSQKSEGWIEDSERFDDGGFSGGTLERPALKRLLAKIHTREVGMVVVYKIDRLTRSLPDFGKLVEQLDRAGCSFVSVTQSFNTSTSTGRLMLNVLLSFAQFEREVTSERIRDKIAASKKKGIWMGGIPPLGYRAQDRKLVIDEAEAGRVRQVFELFEQNRCLMTTRYRAEELGIRSRPYAKHPEGRVFFRSNILFILTNPIYAGQIRHGPTIYQGQHEPIIEPAAWREVQKHVDEYVANHREDAFSRVRQSWLAGKVFDEAGAVFRPLHARKAKKAYRYYVSKTSGEPSQARAKRWRLRADVFEKEVARAVSKHLDKSNEMGPALFSFVPSVHSHLEGGEGTGNRLKRSEQELLDFVESVHPQQGLIEIVLNTSKLATALRIQPESASTFPVRICEPFQMRRANHEPIIVIGDQKTSVDEKLLKFVSRAFVWWRAMLAGKTMAEIGEINGVSAKEVGVHLPAAFLAPDIIESIIDGRHPPNLTVATLRSGKLPKDWVEQRRWLEASNDALATNGARV